MNILRTDLETLKKKRLVAIKQAAEGPGMFEEPRTGIEEVQQRKTAKQKEQILKRYAKEEPAEFHELYVSYDVCSEEEEVLSDTTRELMAPFMVRVLIGKGLPKPVVVHQLLNIVDFIVRSPDTNWE